MKKKDRKKHRNNLFFVFDYLIKHGWEWEFRHENGGYELKLWKPEWKKIDITPMIICPTYHSVFIDRLFRKLANYWKKERKVSK